MVFCSNSDNSLTTNHKFFLKKLDEKNLFITFKKNFYMIFNLF